MAMMTGSSEFYLRYRMQADNPLYARVERTQVQVSLLYKQHSHITILESVQAIETKIEDNLGNPCSHSMRISLKEKSSTHPGL